MTSYLTTMITLLSPFFLFFSLPLKVLSISEVKGLSSPTSACKYLTLNKKINKWDLPGIASLLQSSPNLQKLTINLMPSNNFEVFFYHNITSLPLFLSVKLWFGTLIAFLSISISFYSLCYIINLHCPHTVSSSLCYS